MPRPRKESPQKSLDGPPRSRVAKAIQDSVTPEDREGKVMKVLYLDEAGSPVGEWASSQLPENMWSGQQLAGLQEPPYRLEQLLMLAESHPVHSAALEQKTADVVGKGWEWVPEDENNADDTARDELAAWFEGLAPDELDMKELLVAVWGDVETVGWGLIECLRDPEGAIRRLYHVPGHTVRAHRNGFKLCQIRDNRKVWFRRWGSVDVDGNPVQVDAKTGSMTRIVTPANDLFVIKRPSRRSSWYGIPGYVSAIGWVTLALAVRDDNLFFFANRREPRWAIILTNLADDPDIEEDLRRAFQVDLKQPYRNILVPIAGAGKVEFNKLSDTKTDGSFDRLEERANKNIMVAHRVPSERLANSDSGPLGGHRTAEANRVYKEGVVAPGQEVLAARLNRLIEVEYAIARGAAANTVTTKRRKAYHVVMRKWRKLVTKAGVTAETEAMHSGWTLALADLDIETDREQVDLVLLRFHGDLITLREARIGLNLGPLKTIATPVVNPDTGVEEMPIDQTTGLPYLEGAEIESPLNDKLFSELPGVGAGAAGNVGTPPVGSGGLSGKTASRDGDDRSAVALALLTADVQELMSQGRSTARMVDELADQARSEDATGSPRSG